MSSNWPENKNIKSIHDFSDWLAVSSQQAERVYRGQADSGWNLQPSLDRKVPPNLNYEDRLVKETELIGTFREEAYQFLGNLERSHLGNREDKVIQMTVMQHFGAPTRLLDWTKSVAAAAYFACVDDGDVDGTIWWVNSDDVVSSVDSNWEEWGFAREPDADSQINLNNHIFDESVAQFVSLLYLPIPFARAQSQRGLFTIGSRLGIAHDVQLKDQLPDESYERVVIPANLKGEVIQYLERMGIDAISLQHAGADRVALQMAWDREHSI